MITGVRSALICDLVESDVDHGASYHGIYGGTLYADSKPGYLAAWVALQIEFDAKPSTGLIKLDAPDFTLTVPVDALAGWRLTCIAFPIVLPMLQRGILFLAVSDDQRPESIFRYMWELDFQPNAEILDEAARQDILTASRTAAESFLAGLHARSGGLQ